MSICSLCSLQHACGLIAVGCPLGGSEVDVEGVPEISIDNYYENVNVNKPSDKATSQKVFISHQEVCRYLGILYESYDSTDDRSWL